MTHAKTRIGNARSRSVEPLTLDLGFAPTLSEDWRLVDDGSALGVPAKVLDVPESIPALGYGSHQYFRYYGKFPSIVGREIVSRFSSDGAPVLDCYNGSGTTLVEAQIRGQASMGVDINPLSVLASNVKTAYYDANYLGDVLDEFLAGLSEDPGWRPPATSTWLDKWFSEQAQADLASLRARVEEFDGTPAYEFLAVAFLAIIRRVSRAFDGEVRPHVNREKRERDVREAFELKVLDNISGLRDLDRRRPRGIPSLAVVGDNGDPAVYSDLLLGEQPGLVVAHPPYLNSFNYLHAFSLEFAWSADMRAVWGGVHTKESIGRLEQKAWPATNPSIVESYYSSLSGTLKAAACCARPGAILAVVVGDATIRGVLEPVHRHVWQGMQEQGLEPVEIWYRTTHYGIGKYAYSTRADYHGDAEKKDAILFARIP